MAESRVINSLRNSGVNSISQISNIILVFVERTVFIKLLNIEYLGVNGLFSNILSILSLAELGIGTAIVYMMYKPIAENDTRKVAAYNNLFRQIYNGIGLFILIAGLCITPFILSIIKETPNISENIYVVYILYLINTSVSYFFTHKRSLLIAHQKEYVNSINILQFAIIKDIILIAVLWFSRDYILYLTSQIGITIASNIAISYKTNRLFPDVIKYKDERVSKAELQIIGKNTLAMLCHKMGNVVVSGTTNIFITIFVGITSVGVYSNYILISNCAKQVVGNAVNSITASFGNLVASDNTEHTLLVFSRIYFINNLLALVISVFYYTLITPFITLWIGEEYLLDTISLQLVIVNLLFFSQIRIPFQMVINTYGLFWQIKWKSLVEAIVSIIAILILEHCFNLGITGIILSGLISNIATNMWWEPYVAYRYGLHLPYSDYLRRITRSIIAYFGAILSAHILIESYTVCFNLPIILKLFINMIISLLVIFLVTILLYSKDPNLTYLVSIAKSLLKKKII